MSAQQPILVVDDDRNFARVVQAGLLTAGYTVLVAHTAETALQHLASVPVSLVLLDHHLDHTDGLTLLPVLRAAAAAHTPFLLMTAYDEPGLAHRASRAGAIEVYLKPFDLPDLMVGIRRALADAERLRSGSSIFMPGVEVLLRGSAVRGQAHAWVVRAPGDALVVELRDTPVIADDGVLRGALESDDGVYTFRTRVVESGGGCLALTKPSSLRRRQRRAAPRGPAMWELRMQLGDPSTVAIRAMARDISVGGLGMSSLQPVPTDAVVQVSWDWPRSDVPGGPASARVCRCEPLGAGAGLAAYRLGAQFLSLPAELSSAIGAHVTGASGV